MDELKIIRVREETKERLKKIVGKSWDEIITRLLNAYEENKCKKEQ